MLESLDSGKPIRECQTVDVPDTIHTIRWHAELIDKIYDNTAPVGVQRARAWWCASRSAWSACVLPWNFPLLMLAWKIGPALAAGCSVIVKPAEETSLTTLRVAELALEAGHPGGRLQRRHRQRARTSASRSACIWTSTMVSFTGSTATGRRFLRYCGGLEPQARRARMRRQEPGRGARRRRGPRSRRRAGRQRRLLEHGRELLGHLAAHRPASVKDELLERIGAYMREWKMGDPLDPENRVGALVSTSHFDKVKSYLDDEGREAVVAHGGETQKGIFVEPTVVDGVTPASRLFQEEIFGPILVGHHLRRRWRRPSRSPTTRTYGLAASVYTGSLRNAIKLSREIRAGVVTVNCFGEGDVTTPFGGYKESGFGGRDKSIFAHDQYTELKTIWIDVSDRSVDETVR